jgi:UDPglucose--hexose-1-phosphate uridylyltransferase
MPELRQNRFTKEWVIIATERAKRPDQMIVKREVKPLERYAANCPFCPGNEAQAPPELARLPADGSWQVRVVPNKFAALSREGKPDRTIHRSRRSMNGVGLHEVIAETPDHSLTTALLSDAQVAEIIRMYKYRFHAAHTDPRVAHVTLFKNHGSAGGASLEHPHSQMIATPIISSQVRMRMFEAMRYYDEFGGCIFCQVMEEEMGEQTRIVLTSDHFVAMEPYASGTPFATHIYPRRHMASFGEISVAEIADLGRVLKAVLAKLYWGLENPDFNYTVRTGPPEAEGEKHYHWYISIIPRLTKVAGFELGSGMFINVVLPETAAEFLRNTDVSKRG